MSGPDQPGASGRRANGLPASDWGALVDLDPRLSEGLLDRLAAAGVAAYVEPASAVDTVHRAVTMPVRPLDRLWVDPSRADSARQVVASEVADLTALLAEDEPGATAHGLVHPVPRTGAARVLAPPALPGPPLAPPAVPSPVVDPAGDPVAGPEVPPGTDAPAPAAGRPALPPSEDELFAQLVAQFHSDVVHVRETPVPPPAVPGPADDAPDSPPRGRPTPPDPDRQLRRRRTDPPAPPRRPTAPPPPAPGAALPPLPRWLEPDALPPGEDDGHYVPPPPPPVPRVRARTLGALASVLLGLLVLFAPGVVGLTATAGVGILGIALLAGGAGALVWWMRDSSDDGPGDGAVV